MCLTVVVTVDVVVVVDSLELELDEEYPDGDDGGGVLLLDDGFERVRSALRSTHFVWFLQCVFN